MCSCCGATAKKCHEMCLISHSFPGLFQYAKQAASSLLLTSFEHDYHVTVLPQARRDSACLSPLSLGQSFLLFSMVSFLCCSDCVCVRALSSHSLWHSSFQCGHRNQSVLRWPHSPPRWRRGLRCAAGRTPLWKERRRKRWSSGVCLMGMQLLEITQNKSNP